MTVPGSHTYTTPAGNWGWLCDACLAESRYIYATREHAERLRRAHARYCRGHRRRKAKREVGANV